MTTSAKKRTTTKKAATTCKATTKKKTSSRRRTPAKKARTNTAPLAPPEYGEGTTTNRVKPEEAIRYASDGQVHLTVIAADPVGAVELPEPSPDDTQSAPTTGPASQETPSSGSHADTTSAREPTEGNKELAGFDSLGRTQLQPAKSTDTNAQSANIAGLQAQPLHPVIAAISPDLVQLDKYDESYPYTERLPCKLRDDEISECAMQLASRMRQMDALLVENRRKRAYLRELEAKKRAEIEELQRAVTDGEQLRHVEVLAVADIKQVETYKVRLDNGSRIPGSERTMNDDELHKARQTALPGY